VDADGDAKLAMALRSFSLAQTEADELRAGSEKLAAQNAALAAQLAEVKGALSANSSANRTAATAESSTAAQAAALREQLRQTQAQAAAVADENAQLKARLTGAAPPADAEALRARAADAERKAAAAQNAARSLADENARLKETLSSVSQTVGRAVGIATPPAGSPAVVSRVEPPAIARPDAPTRPSSAATAATPVPTNSQLPITNSPAPAARLHTIATGDTLTKISRQYYGTPDRWPEILAANRDVMRDEKNLVIGRTLKIP
jgi:nucleoid-associated protein YgaU